MKEIDLTGKTFGRLTVIKRNGNQNKKIMWECACECGEIALVRSDHLKAGKTVSCGCYFKEVMANLNKTHGKSYTRVYRIWRNMINRCTNPNVGEDDWNRYGGRGIIVCDRWKNSFEKFLEDMGEPPHGMSIDRFPDVNGNYEPTNCRWATNKEQQNNKRSNRIIEFSGKRLTLAQWSDEVGLPYHAISDRLDKLGWTIERALTEPIHITRPRR